MSFPFFVTKRSKQKRTSRLGGPFVRLNLVFGFQRTCSVANILIVRNVTICAGNAKTFDLSPKNASKFQRVPAHRLVRHVNLYSRSGPSHFPSSWDSSANSGARFGARNSKVWWNTLLFDVKRKLWSFSANVAPTYVSATFRILTILAEIPALLLVQGFIRFHETHCFGMFNAPRSHNI